MAFATAYTYREIRALIRERPIKRIKGVKPIAGKLMTAAWNVKNKKEKK